jgi:uncharacterized membrane protein
VVARERVAKRREGNEIEFSRIVAFSDGVFAIAITLLVLNLEIPKELADSAVGSALWDLRDDFVAFGVSFAVIGRFWVLHHRFFGEVTGFDGRLLTLNLFYLVWIVLIPFSSELLGEYGESTAAVVFYSVDLAATVLVGMLIALYAERAGLTRQLADDRSEARLHSLYIAVIFLASIPVAFVAPGIAPLIWLALFLDPLRGLRRLRA